MILSKFSRCPLESGGHLVHRHNKFGGPAQNLVDFVHQMIVFFSIPEKYQLHDTFRNNNHKTQACRQFPCSAQQV